MPSKNVHGGVNPDFSVDQFDRAVPERRVKTVIQETHGACPRFFGIHRNVTTYKNIVSVAARLQNLRFAF